MPRLHTILSVLALSALSSCATPVAGWGSAAGPRPQTAEEVFAKTRAKFDSYKKSAEITGPVFWLSDHTVFLLRSMFQGESPSAVQLYISDEGVEWRNFSNANDSSGVALPLIPITKDAEPWSYRSVGGVRCYEHVAVEMSPEYTRLHSSTGIGISIKIWGNAGERIVDVPAYYVEGFLRKLDEYAAEADGLPASAQE